MKIAPVMERLKWPFLKGRIEFPRSNLERLKSTLVLMLNVITYARQVSEKYVNLAYLTLDLGSLLFSPLDQS